MPSRGTNFSMSMIRVLLELHLLEVFLVEQHVLVFGDREAFYQVAARDLLAGAGVDRLHLDAVVGRAD